MSQKPTVEELIETFKQLEKEGRIIVHKWPTKEDDTFSVTVTEATPVPPGEPN